MRTSGVMALTPNIVMDFLFGPERDPEWQGLSDEGSVQYHQTDEIVIAWREGHHSSLSLRERRNPAVLLE
jgi:hypothetical protein